MLTFGCHRRAGECTEPETWVRDHDWDRDEHEKLFGLWRERTEVTVAFTPDLDGDGRRDVMAHGHGECGSGGCTWDLFVAGDSCSRHVGWVLGDDVTLLPTRHEGMADLATTFRGGSGSYEELHYEARDGRYSQTERRSCEPWGCEPWVADSEP